MEEQKCMPPISREKSLLLNKYRRNEDGIWEGLPSNSSAFVALLLLISISTGMQLESMKPGD